MSDEALALRDVAVARGGLRLLEGVSLSLGRGEAMALRGPNGIGKTTLLRCVAGLAPVAAGTIEPGPDRIAYAGHRDGIKAVMGVAETLRFWAGIHGRSGIGAALAAFELEGLADRAVRHLSAGQARRLGLARLLVTGRPVWALDEPTVSLDAHSVTLFAAALRRHLQGGGAALVATHAELGLETGVMDLGAFRARRSESSPGAGGFDEPVA